MATHNGAAFVAEQLRSILAELEPSDEIVVIDDASTDNTVSIIEDMSDPRIRVLRQNPNRGYVRTFERALAEARGDLLFLSDQDDEWVPGRRDALVRALDYGGVAASNLELLTSGEPMRSPLTRRPWLLDSAASRHRVRNELRILVGDAPYFGCAMALRRDALALVIPFPSYLEESHDLWIATVANASGGLVHVDKTTVRRRLHGGNASSERPRGIRTALASRLLLMRLLVEAHCRIRAVRRL